MSTGITSATKHRLLFVVPHYRADYFNKWLRKELKADGDWLSPTLWGPDKDPKAPRIPYAYCLFQATDEMLTKLLDRLLLAFGERLPPSWAAAPMKAKASVVAVSAARIFAEVECHLIVIESDKEWADPSDRLKEFGFTPIG